FGCDHVSPFPCCFYTAHRALPRSVMTLHPSTLMRRTSKIRCGSPHVTTIQSTRCTPLARPLFYSTFLLPVGCLQSPGKGSRLIFNYCWGIISTNIWQLRR